MRHLGEIWRRGVWAAERASEDFVSLVFAILAALTPFVALKLGRSL